MSKKENVAGRLGWQGKAQAHRKRFFLIPTTGGHYDSYDRIWKIAFTFVEKIGGDIFKADTWAAELGDCSPPPSFSQIFAKSPFFASNFGSSMPTAPSRSS